MKKTSIISIVLLLAISLKAQNYNFNFNTSGQRACLVSSTVNLNTPSVTIHLLDASQNTNDSIFIYRRQLNGSNWNLVATGLPPSTAAWQDTNVNLGDTWEYQVKRKNTWTYNTTSYDATGYTIGTVLKDNSNYQGQMILLVSNDVTSNLAAKYLRLKKELTAEGWYVNELIVNRANNWDSGDTVVQIKNQITSLYNNAPLNDKPKCLFILGHVPLPRSGSTAVAAPDEHNENKGARGCDAYYADINGVYTDTATYTPAGLASPLASNLPNDYKWDQDFFPSDIELSFGRIDFADISDDTTSELQLISNYLDRLSHYKNVDAGYNMGEKSAFYFGYDNSNDGAYRSLPNISKPADVYQNNVGPAHPQWVQNNGPFKIYMQNLSVPDYNEWLQFGMDATVFSSDQSYWGFGDVPQNGSLYSRIRALLAAPTKCLITLWTTTGINIFHQACTGEAFSIAMKEIMNHNSSNQKLEKAPQDYDTEDWWNRTHFTFYGDPTIRLYQVAPITNLSITGISGTAQLQWTASIDPNILGYNIYESNTELGVYTKINTSPISSTNYTITNYQTGKWYMVKATKILTSGCGQFIHPSIGKSIQGTLALSQSVMLQNSEINIYPIPTNNTIYVQSDKTIENIKVLGCDGQILKSIDVLHKNNVELDLQSYSSGMYYIKINSQGNSTTRKVIKIK